jgi:D-alanyl-D-alanine carboxypeptidase
MRKHFAVISLCIVLAAAGAAWWILHKPIPPADEYTVKPVITKIEKPAPTPAATSFNKSQYSLDDPTSIWVVANKLRPLNPKEYEPADLVTPNVPTRVAGMQLRQAAATALEQLFAAAQQNGTALRLSSGYRSYTYQVNLYNGYVKSQGQASADSQSARPGFSEHQTGLAADVGGVSGGCNVEQCFGQTAAGKWLAANAYKHGFIIRYPNGLTNITGYTYEPWHVRYVGVELATEMHNQSIQTLEEFFGLPAAPDYSAN